MDIATSLRQPKTTPAASRWLRLVVAAVVPCLTGCPTEVPYESAGSEESAEAPAFDSTGQLAEAAGDSELPTRDRYSTPAADEPTKQYPWETDDSGEASPEVERLFGTAEDSPEPPAEAVAEPPAEEDDGGFGAFLGEAYAGMIAEPEQEAGSTTAEDPKVEVEAEAPPVETVAQAPPPSSADLFGNLGDLDNLPEDDPEDFSELDLPIDVPATAATPDTATPKPPTTTEPADSDRMADLWGDEDSAVAAEAPAAEPQRSEPSPVEASGLPFGEPAIAASETPRSERESTPPWEPPPEEPTPSVPRGATASEPLPEPVDIFDEPGFEPQAEPTRDRTSLLGSASVKPLPAVPVLTYNTRHLAWLLGGKLGLAELAELDGATPSEVADWSREVDRLSKALKLESVGGPSRSSAEPAARVQGLMDRAARLGGQLADSHGRDHAALLEIALKSNALLVIAERRPDLAGPAGRAIREAATRAMLPRFLWEETVKTLDREPTTEEALDAIVRLHNRVESFLR